jgi:hypothetical protein
MISKIASGFVYPIGGRFSVFDVSMMASLSGLLYHYWGEGLGEALAKQVGVNPPTSDAFKTAGGSFAALVGSLGWTTVKNLVMNVWETTVGRPSCSGVLSVIGILVATGTIDVALLVAYPLLTSYLGQKDMQNDNDDELAKDIKSLDLMMQGCLVLAAMAGVYSLDRLSRSEKRQPGKAAREKASPDAQDGAVQKADDERDAEASPLINKPEPKTVGGLFCSVARSAGSYLGLCNSSAPGLSS